MIERTADLITAFAISWMAYEYYIFPRVDALSSFDVVFIFTVISFIRGYFWRRFFNAGIHKAVHRAIVNIGVSK